MAVIWADGFERGIDPFDFNNIGTDVITKQTDGITTPYMLAGSYCFSVISSYGYIYKTLPSRSEIYLQFAFTWEKFLESDPSGFGFFKWGQGANVLGTLQASTERAALAAFTGDSSTLVGTGVTKVPSIDRIYPSWAWYIIELYIKIDSTAGVISLRVDGNPEFTFTGNTNPGGYNTINRLTLTGRGTGNGFFIDDFIVNDTTGTDNNSWPGGQNFVALTPNAVGALTQFTPSTGSTNYLCVDEIPANTTDYVSGYPDQVDLYNVSGIPAGSSVGILRPFVSARKNGVYQNPNMQIGTLSAGVTTFGSSFPLTRTFKNYWGDILTTNPATSLPWTDVEVNALQLGIKAKN